MSQLLEKYNNLFLQHFIKLKMYHFQTSLYSAHKTVDAYLTKFLLNYDQFMEVAQGIFGIIKLPPTLEIKTKVDKREDIVGSLKEFSVYLKTLNENLKGDQSQYTSLYNIRDTMLADIQQLEYLLKFT